jgi:hypothetical protein
MSQSVGVGAVSSLPTQQFTVSGGAPAQFAYRNANQESDCYDSSADGLNLYSAAQPIGSAFLDIVAGGTTASSSLLDGQAFLCAAPASSGSVMVDLAQWYPWQKEASWQELAFLKTQSATLGGQAFGPGKAFGASVAVAGASLVVIDNGYSSYPSYSQNAQAYVYQASGAGQASLANTFAIGNNTSLALSSLAGSADGNIAVAPGSAYDYADVVDIATGAIATLAFPAAGTFNSATGPVAVSALPPYYKTPAEGLAFDSQDPGLLAVGFVAGQIPTVSGFTASFAASEVGGAFLYRRQGAGPSATWAVDSWYSTWDATVGSAHIGASVAASGGLVAAGAPGKQTLTASGYAQTGAIYAWLAPSGASSGSAYMSPILLQGSDDPGRGHAIGNSVAIYYDRLTKTNIVLAGDPLAPRAASSGTAASAGAVLYWKQDSPGGGFSTPAGTLTSAFVPAVAGGSLGSAIAVGGNHIVAGAPGQASAAIWNYEGGQFVEKPALKSSFQSYLPGAGYGASVAAGPEYILIGSPADTTTGWVSTGLLIAPVPTSVAPNIPAGQNGANIGGASIFSGYR